MKAVSLLKAGVVGLALATAGLAWPGSASAQNLRVMNGGATSALQVPMNRAVVVESDTPFAELSIANPGIADISTLSDRAIYVLGKVPGRTTLTVLGGDGRLIANVEVQVTPDISEFKERLRQILPGEPIEVRTANDGIVLSGTVSSAEKLDRALSLANRYAPDRISNMMSVAGSQQVMLNVRFAEVNRSASKQLTSPLGGVQGSGGFFIQQLTTGVTQVSGSLALQAALEALETRGLSRTLAEPNLVALSGQEARFLAGGEYPIPVPDSDGRVGITYKPFGVELTFTPWVLDGGLINLTLNAAVSGIDTSITLQSGGFAVNAFRRRETSTTIELRDGESFAIAGLLQDDYRSLMNQLPWIADVPVLGALFRSGQFRREQTELVIVVSAHLVTPTRGEAIALPTDRVRPPAERDFFLGGRMSATAAQSGAVGEIARQGFSGSYGYVLD